MKCRVFYHDHCFDGACSASLFTRFHRECIGTAQDYSYFGLMHRAGALFEEEAFVDGENAIVDFKYSASPRVTWWFDHHQSAFLTPQDQQDFLAWQARADAANAIDPANIWRGGKFYDPHYVSCTSLIADVARERFGFDTKPLAELIHWADIVDGARYESAEAAVGMAAPAMKLTMVIESSGEGFVPRIIPLLTEMSLQDVLDQPFIQAELGPLMERHLAGIELLRERAPCFEPRRHHLRYHRPAHRGLQQVHPLLSLSCRDLQRGTEPIELPHQGRRGDESVDQGAGGTAR